MKSLNKNIIINSTILFVIASIIEQTLHECGHFFAGILVHSKEVVLYHNYMSSNDSDLSSLKIIIVKASGPIVSLLIGIIFHLICSFQQKRNLLFLFNLYMSVFGYIGFWGYIMISPFFIYGDTGYIFFTLGFPLWLTILIATSGAIILFFIMKKLTRFFVETGSLEIIENTKERKSFIESLIFYPLFLGIIITTLMNLPVPTLLSLIAPICSPFTILWTYGYALKEKYPLQNSNKEFDKLTRLNTFLPVILCIIIIINRLLVYGIIYH